MIPIVLVTGFLGSGKTTFLQNVTRSEQGKDVVFLVNEFGELNVDAARIEGLGAEVFEVTGGSLFCECKVADFISNLKKICEYFHSSDRKLRGVVIETSGIADPQVMAKLLHDTGFAKQYFISRIIALVSTHRFADFAKAFPNLVSQIRTSDCVLLNKTDLATEPELIEVEEQIRSIKPDVEIIRTQYSETHFDLWVSAGKSREKIGELSGYANPYATVLVVPRQDYTVEDLKKFCLENCEKLLRVKGVILEAKEVFRVDFSYGQFEQSPEDGRHESSQLVFVVAEEDEAWAKAAKDLLNDRSLE